MKNSLLIACCMLGTVATAQAQDYDLYAFGGPKYFSGDDLNITATSMVSGVLYDLSTVLTVQDGFGYEGGIGFRFDGIRLGMVVDHVSSKVENDAAGAGGTDYEAFSLDSSSRFSQTGIKVDVTYAFENQSRFTPFVSGRVGITDLNADLTAVRPAMSLPFSNRVQSISFEGIPLSYGAAAGFEYELTDKISAYVSGDYSRIGDLSGSADVVATVRVECSMGCFAPTLLDRSLSDDLNDFSMDQFNVSAGVRFFF